MTLEKERKTLRKLNRQIYEGFIIEYDSLVFIYFNVKYISTISNFILKLHNQTSFYQMIK